MLISFVSIMIKKLDRLILRSFWGPFLLTFFIAFFVLMMQSLWKYIDDLVGKGLDFFTICSFLWYASASLLIFAMPIAILISSIMTFGNMGEHFELVAIKSAGISLLRFMRPLLWVTLFLCGITFIFANYVIPYANLKFLKLYSDIYIKKPAFDLKEGVFFTHIPNYAIKVGKKDPDGKTIHQVVIFEQGGQVQDNCIIAEKGSMQISSDNRFLEFDLQNGYRYQERGSVVDSNTEYTRIGFKQFKKLFDLGDLQMKKTDDSLFRRNFRMLNVRQLQENMDSIRKSYQSTQQMQDNDWNRTLPYWKLSARVLKKAKKSTPIKPFHESQYFQVKQTSLNKIAEWKNIIEQHKMQLDFQEKEIRLHQMEWHKKFAWSLACLVLFFIGAPLGAIIRKGGLGLPLVFAIVFFLLFHVINMFGEKFSKEGITSPFVGMWMAVMVLIPIGIFLTYKASNDAPMFNKGFYRHWFRRNIQRITNPKT
jgi:lipopolysaccharide export system permease protein